MAVKCLAVVPDHSIVIGCLCKTAVYHVVNQTLIKKTNAWSYKLLVSVQSNYIMKTLLLAGCKALLWQLHFK